MLLLGFAFAYLGMTLLCLTMNRHRSVLWRAERRLPAAALMRLLASGCFVMALGLCVASEGGEVGTVVWFCLLMLSALQLVLLLAWRAQWVLPMVPVLGVAGALQGVL